MNSKSLAIIAVAAIVIAVAAAAVLLTNNNSNNNDTPQDEGNSALDVAKAFASSYNGVFGTFVASEGDTDGTAKIVNTYTSTRGTTEYVINVQGVSGEAFDKASSIISSMQDIRAATGGKNMLNITGFDKSVGCVWIGANAGESDGVAYKTTYTMFAFAVECGDYLFIADTNYIFDGNGTASLEDYEKVFNTILTSCGVNGVSNVAYSDAESMAMYMANAYYGFFGTFAVADGASESTATATAPGLRSAQNVIYTVTDDAKAKFEAAKKAIDERTSTMPGATKTIFEYSGYGNIYGCRFDNSMAQFSMILIAAYCDNVFVDAYTGYLGVYDSENPGFASNSDVAAVSNVILESIGVVKNVTLPDDPVDTTVEIVDSAGNSYTLDGPLDKVCIISGNQADFFQILDLGDKIAGASQTVFNSESSYKSGFLSNVTNLGKYSDSAAIVENIVTTGVKYVLTPTSMGLKTEAINNLQDNYGITVITLECYGETMIQDAEQIVKMFGSDSAQAKYDEYLSLYNGVKDKAVKSASSVGSDISWIIQTPTMKGYYTDNSEQAKNAATIAGHNSLSEWYDSSLDISGTFATPSAESVAQQSQSVGIDYYIVRGSSSKTLEASAESALSSLGDYAGSVKAIADGNMYVIDSDVASGARDYIGYAVYAQIFGANTGLDLVGLANEFNSKYGFTEVYETLLYNYGASSVDTSNAESMAKYFCDNYSGFFGLFSVADGASVSAATATAPGLRSAQNIVYTVSSDAASQYASAKAAIDARESTMPGATKTIFTVDGYDNIYGCRFDNAMAQFSMVLLTAYNGDVYVDAYTGYLGVYNSENPGFASDADIAAAAQVLLESIGVDASVTISS